jgi:hypothetical protein
MATQYKNYHIMREARQALIPGSICARCHGPAAYIHHKDFTKNNHKIENLLPVCGICHFKIHKMGERIHKHKLFVKGKTLHYWAKKLGLSYGRIWDRNKKKIPLTGRKTKYERLYGHTLKEMGDRLGVSRERVRQLHQEKLLRVRLTIIK